MVQGILKIISKLSSVLVNMMWPLKYCQNLHDTCTDIVCKLLTKSEGGRSQIECGSILTCHPDVPTPPVFLMIVDIDCVLHILIWR